MAKAKKSAFSLDVQGLKDFQRDLRAADKELDSDYSPRLRAANKAVAELVAVEARSRAPVLSGRLSASIGAGASGRSAYVKAGTPGRVPYAPIQEFGWPGHGISPQPFLYPAIAAKSESAVEEYAESIDAIMRPVFPEGSLF